MHNIINFSNGQIMKIDAQVFSQIVCIVLTMLTGNAGWQANSNNIFGTACGLAWVWGWLFVTSVWWLLWGWLPG